MNKESQRKIFSHEGIQNLLLYHYYDLLGQWKWVKAGMGKKLITTVTAQQKKFYTSIRLGGQYSLIYMK